MGILKKDKQLIYSKVFLMDLKNKLIKGILDKQ